MLLLLIMNSCAYLAAPVSYAPTNGEFFYEISLFSYNKAIKWFPLRMEFWWVDYMQSHLC